PTPKISPLSLHDALPICNFWVLDLTPDDVDTAPVFYLCHDPPVLVYQSPSLGHFLDELLRMYEAPHTSTIREVREERTLVDEDRSEEHTSELQSRGQLVC